MSTLRFETQTIVASDLGGENPLADMPPPPDPENQTPINPDLPEAEKEFVRAAELRGCIPYRVLNRYDRGEVERPFKVAILENEHVKATVLLELGGRLWSLVHKPTGRELLYQPRVLHYANISLCNAWFCGGVEWNVAVRGHAAYTCRPLFAARLRADDGSPVLRLYEYDRFRGLLFQIDLFAPAGMPALLVRPRVVNPHRETTAMYWWSNIAVAEVAGHRVLAPATSAYHHAYDGRLLEIPVPISNGIDASYPARSPSAHDWFYSIPQGNRPWIASLDPAGQGLIHASTARLMGRKLFAWGMGRGGRRWQEHLGGRGTGYVEIQGGLGRTQSGYQPMPPRADWAWLEAYMLMEADPRLVHGEDWPAACRHVQERLDALAPQGRLEEMLTETASMAHRPPEEIAFRGSGWGALEERRCRADGEEPAVPPSMVFDEASLGADQAPWLALLEEGALPYRSPAEEPGVWMTAPPWRKRLAASARTRRGDHWLTWLHLGVAAYRAGEHAAATEAWRKSLETEPSAWAYRNLGLLARHAGPRQEAAELYVQASALRPDLYELQLECGRALAEAERFAELDRWITRQPDRIRRMPRVDILAAQAAMHRGELDAALATLEAVRLTDNREGDNAISDLWFEIRARQIAAQEAVPLDEALRDRVRETLNPPEHLDYRMAKPARKPAPQPRPTKRE